MNRHDLFLSTTWMNLGKNIGDIRFAQVKPLTFPNFALKFPDFSEFYKISRLFHDFFQVPQNSLTFPGFQKFQVCWPPYWIVYFQISFIFGKKQLQKCIRIFFSFNLHSKAALSTRTVMQFFLKIKPSVEFASVVVLSLLREKKQNISIH